MGDTVSEALLLLQQLSLHCPYINKEKEKGIKIDTRRKINHISHLILSRCEGSVMGVNVYIPPYLSLQLSPNYTISPLAPWAASQQSYSTITSGLWFYSLNISFWVLIALQILSHMLGSITMARRAASIFWISQYARFLTTPNSMKPVIKTPILYASSTSLTDIVGNTISHFCP